MTNVVKKITKRRRSGTDYINNTDLYNAMCKYLAELRQARTDEVAEPRIPDYIGKCILDITTRFATLPMYSGYIFKEEMIGDAIENIVMYIDTFNEKLYNKPFVWMTMICYHAFLRRIAKEKKQLYVKHKLLHREHLFGLLQENQITDGDDGHQSVNILDNTYMSSLVEDFENKLKEKKKKKKDKENE